MYTEDNAKMNTSNKYIEAKLEDPAIIKRRKKKEHCGCAAY